MPSWLPSIPYPPVAEGYWAPVTSTINWCEEDYYVTAYSAEIINAFTNLTFTYLALKGITNCLDNGHPRIFLVGFFSYLMIGVGSFIFHSTLKYSTQLLDELSMIYTTCILFYATFENGLGTHGKTGLAALTAGIATAVTGVYHWLGDPVFHQNMFALITGVVFVRSVWVMEMTLRPRWRRRDGRLAEAEQRRRDARDEQTLTTMWALIPVGLGSVGMGFLIWNLDNAYCSSLRAWRRELGLPWGVLLEGHGWWHCFTSIAEYFNLVWCLWLRYCLLGKQDEVKLVWPSLFTSVPKVVRKDTAFGKKIQ